MRVLVTRSELVPRLEALGHEVVLRELIRVEPLGDEPIDASAYDWLVVTSANGARELARRGVTANRIAAIGPATAGVLREHGLRVDLVPGTHTQEGLRDELSGTLLLAAAEGARRDVLDADFVPLYRTIELPQEVDADLALLLSSSAVRALRTRMPVVAMGPQTAAEAEARGFEVVAVAHPHTLAGLIDAVASLGWAPLTEELGLRARRRAARWCVLGRAAGTASGAPCVLPSLDADASEAPSLHQETHSW